MPIIFNDEVFIPSLEKFGIPSQDVWDYTNDGCWQVTIPGKTDFRYTQFSALRCLERALNKGYGRLSGKKEGVDTPDPYCFTSFDEVMEAFKAQLDYAMKQIMDITAQYYGCLYDIAPVPFLSSLVEDCLEEGKDITEGGARYIIHALMLMGLSNVADSLAAIKKLVFEEKVVEWSHLLRSLEDNFLDAEDLRQILITRAPKYGTDSEYVDTIARKVLEYFVERVDYHDRSYENKKLRFSTAVGTLEFYVAGGEFVGATPDGRLATTPIGCNLSPSEGRATKGHTAAINSYNRMNLIDLPTGSALDLGIEKRAVAGDEGLQRLSALVKSFLDKGGNILTINVHGVEELREAQREPDRYRDLVVRVGGWQAYFVDLPLRYQESIIKRVEQYGR